MVRNARAAGRVGPVVMVRDARPDEFDGIGDLRVAAYRADGFLPATSGYAATLRSLGADGQAEARERRRSGRWRSPRARAGGGSAPRWSPR